MVVCESIGHPPLPAARVTGPLQYSRLSQQLGPGAIQITVVFPCYNEENRLPASLATVQRYLRSRALSYEVLTVDDGSTDATAEVAETAANADRGVRLVRLGVNAGKGTASALGARHATGSWILSSDADLSTPIEALKDFVPYLSQGYDIVIGSRALADSRLVVRRAWWRERVRRAMNAAIRSGAWLPFRDTQCGFKLYSRDAGQTIFPLLTTRRWLFDAEALLLRRECGTSGGRWYRYSSAVTVLASIT